MAVRGETYTPDVSRPYVLHQRQRTHLLYLRERLREINQQLFEVCCQLQRQFDPKDLGTALVLVAELKTLKACEDELEQQSAVTAQVPWLTP